jgi:transcriptional antiterminator NusG
MSEVNRMLGKVDELAVNTHVLYLNLGETKVVDGLLMVSMVLLKINEEKRKLEVWLKFSEEKHH